MVDIHGTGPSAEAAALALAKMTQQISGLTLWVAPAMGVTPRGSDAAASAMQALYLAPLALAARLTQDLPAPLRDATGEPAAERQLLLMIERRLMAPGSGFPEERAAIAALLAWVEEAALRFAPCLRINVVALPLLTPPDLTPALAWVAGRQVVTGQVVKLGPPPPSTAPFRSDTA